MKFDLKNLKIKLENFFALEYFRSAFIQWVLIGSLIVNLANWGFIAFFIRPVDFLIILHYNVYFGVDVIGSWWQMYLMPSIGLFLLLVNATLGFLFYQRKERIVAHLLMLATFIVQVGLSIGVASLLLINY
ncbi:MAG: hypothetical protein WCJ51_03620 [Candidatus Moraniibacteriota bacterium]